MKRRKQWDLEQLTSTSANQELYKSYTSVCDIQGKSGRNEVMVSLVLLTVKSLKTRFREPLRRAMRAALGWFTIAFGARGVGVLPAAGGVLQNTNTTVSILVFIKIVSSITVSRWIKKGCMYWEEVWLGLCVCCSSSLSPASKASREQCLSWKREWKYR